MADVEALTTSYPPRFAIVWRHASHRDGCVSWEIFASPDSFARRVVQEHFGANTLGDTLAGTRLAAAAAATTTQDGGPGIANPPIDMRLYNDGRSAHKCSSREGAVGFGWHLVVRSHDGVSLARLWKDHVQFSGARRRRVALLPVQLPVGLCVWTYVCVCVCARARA